MELIKCKVKDKILFLDKALDVGTKKKKVSLFRVATSPQTVINSSIEDSNVFSRKE